MTLSPNNKLKGALIERCGTLTEANVRLGLPRGSVKLSRIIRGRLIASQEMKRKIAWLTQRKIEDLFPNNSQGEDK
jgi:hypothetical protein